MIVIEKRGPQKTVPLRLLSAGQVFCYPAHEGNIYILLPAQGLDGRIKRAYAPVSQFVTSLNEECEVVPLKGTLTVEDADG